MTQVLLSKRLCPRSVMQNFAKRLTDANRMAIALYFGTRQTPYIPVARSYDSQLGLGHPLAIRGSEEKHVQGCKRSHGPDATGVLHAAPYMAGQSAEYSTSSHRSFKDGSRASDPGKLMYSVAAGETNVDISAADPYFSTVANTWT